MSGRKIDDLPSKGTLAPTDELIIIDNTGNEGARVLASELQNAIDDTALSADLISADADNELVQGSDSLLYTASPVQTVFGRSGAVVAQSGDYDASEVTNAFDTTSNTTDDVAEGSTNLYNRVPTGGTAGQVLEKIDGTDYNTQWVTPSGGSSTFKGFYARRTADQSLSAGVATVLSFNAEDYDTDGWHSSGTFQPTEAGYYKVFVEARFLNSSTSTTSALAIRLNGTDFKGNATDVGNSAGAVTLNTSGTFYLNGTTDYVQCVGFQSTAVTVDGETSQDRTFFYGYKVGG